MLWIETMFRCFSGVPGMLVLKFSTSLPEMRWEVVGFSCRTRLHIDPEGLEGIP